MTLNFKPQDYAFLYPVKNGFVIMKQFKNIEQDIAIGTYDDQLVFKDIIEVCDWLKLNYKNLPDRIEEI